MFIRIISGNVKGVNFSRGQLYVNGSSVEIKSVSLITAENKKNFLPSAVVGTIGLATFGLPGVLAGVLSSGNSKRVLFACELKDGRTFVAEADLPMYQLFLSAAAHPSNSTLTTSVPPKTGVVSQARQIECSAALNQPRGLLSTSGNTGRVEWLACPRCHQKFNRQRHACDCSAILPWSQVDAEVAAFFAAESAAFEAAAAEIEVQVSAKTKVCPYCAEEIKRTLKSAVFAVNGYKSSLALLLYYAKHHSLSPIVISCEPC